MFAVVPRVAKAILLIFMIAQGLSDIHKMFIMHAKFYPFISNDFGTLQRFKENPALHSGCRLTGNRKEYQRVSVRGVKDAKECLVVDGYARVFTLTFHVIFALVGQPETRPPFSPPSHGQ